MNNTSSESSFEDAPLLNLLNKPLQDMTTEELREHVQQLREVSSSSQSLKKMLSNEKSEAKPKAVKEQQVKALASKYLNMGQ